MNYCCICGEKANHLESFHCMVDGDVYHYCHKHSFIGKSVYEKIYHNSSIGDNMICYRCQHAYTCDWIKFAHNEKFEISNCENFSEMHEFRYKHIAENDALMKLIYDYFTGRVDGHSDEETKEVLTRVMRNL